jgi:DNA invertase Pin-like site-specific DNA recombinase
MTSAVIYAAKSTQDVKGSIPTQFADCRAMAEREGWTVEGEYEDEAKSAYHGSRGDGLTRAKADAERLVAEGHEAVLVVQHSDRLARGDGGREAAHLVEFSLWRAKSGVAIRSVQDDATWTTPMGHLIPALMGERNYEDSRRKGLAVKAGMKRSAERGMHMGRAPFGYRRQGPKLVIVPAQATIVEKVFRDYVAGVSVRALAQALNKAELPTGTGGEWTRSAIGRMLANVAYTGKVTARGDEGERTVVAAKHRAIVDDELWSRAQAIRAGALKRKPGRHADGQHLLVRGLLRCPRCGSAMIPRNARPRLSRAVYHCGGRTERGREFCDQPSVQREAIDGPFLEALLDSYVDIEATVQRIAERQDGARAAAREAITQREAEAAKIERALATTERDYDAGDITGRQYNAREARLTDELDAVRRATEQARDHVKRIEQDGLGDAEQYVLDHLATIKKAVSDGIGAAPDLNALRHTIAQMFESVRLVPSGKLPLGDLGAGFIPFDDEVPAVTDGHERYWLLLMLRWSAVDRDTFEPVGQPMPVGDGPQEASLVAKP